MQPGCQEPLRVDHAFSHSLAAHRNLLFSIYHPVCFRKGIAIFLRFKVISNRGDSSLE